MPRQEQHPGPETFRTQSYLRLLKYARPYWWRLVIGIGSGMLVGGSLLVSLLLIPKLVGVVDTNTATHPRAELSAAPALAEKAEAKLPETPGKTASPEDGFDESFDDPQLAKLLSQAREYASKYRLPIKVSGRKVEVLWPWEFSFEVADRTGRIAWQIFAFYMIGFVLAWTFKNLATYLNRYFMRYVGNKVVADLREEVFAKLMQQSMRFYGNYDVGHLISRCTNDTSAIEQSVSDVIADLTSCPIQIIACLTAVLLACREYKSYSLVVILLCGVPVVVLPIAIIGRKIRKVYKKTFARIAEVVSRMHEVFTGIRVVKAFHTEKQEINRFNTVNRKYFRDVIKALRLQLLLSPTMEVVAVAATLVFLLYSYSQGITLTELAALLAPAFMAYQPIKDMSKLVTYWQRSMAAADRYFALIDTDTSLPEAENAVELASFNDKISFHHVSFGYSDVRIIDDISFDIPKGSVVAVVGETGSGKSTLANLLARFYDVDDGSVTIDGIDVRDYRIASLRKLIGVVHQDAVLFNDTIANNICYGTPAATREEIIEAAKLANAHEFITGGKHEKGYDSEVGEKGFRLSGGEKQRISIARAILRNPPILILDEATSALDTVTEKLVQEALNRVMENRTVFAIAHRLSTIRNADMIMVLRNGHIVERGTHAELLANNKIYRRLYDTQFALDEGAE